jgi:hypothetical protein
MTYERKNNILNISILSDKDVLLKRLCVIVLCFDF